MNRLQTLAGALGLLLVASAVPLVARADAPPPAGAAGAAEPAEKVETMKIVVVTRDGDKVDRLERDDLGALAEGESRELTTESGKKVVVRREQGELRITVDGKEIAAGEGHGFAFHHGEGGEKSFHWMGKEGQADGSPCAGGGHRRVYRIVEKDGEVVEGEEDGEMQVRVIRKVLDQDGKVVEEGPEHNLVFVGHGLSEPGFGAELAIERLEASPDFQALDAQARETVLRLLREPFAEPGKRVEVRVLEEKKEK